MDTILVFLPSGSHKHRQQRSDFRRLSERKSRSKPGATSRDACASSERSERPAALSHYRNQKPSRSRQIIAGKRGSGESPKTTSQTRGFVRGTKRRARLLAKVYDVNPPVCPKYAAQMKENPVTEDPEQIKCNVQHLVKIVRPALAALFSCNRAF